MANQAREQLRPKDPRNLDFEVIRQPFHQLFSIHGFMTSEDGGSVKQVPFVYIFLSRRQTTDYVQVFQEVQRLLPGMAAVQTISADFEKATWAAVRQINLGVFQEDPSTIAGTINILSGLHAYVPVRGNSLVKLVCYGDGLSCERHNDAHKARANGATPVDRLEGLEPAAQEFHKRMLLLQDVMDVFFCGSGLTDKGTLCHLKNLLGFRNVTKDVGSSFNYVSEFLYVVTVGYIVLLAMYLLNMQEIGDTLNDSITLDDITDHIIEEIWMESNFDEVVNPVSEEQLYEYCFCRQEKDDNMIECSGSRCRSGKWFHLACIEMEQEDVPDGDWFCQDCQERRSTYPFCICYSDLGTAMIACDNPDCEREWFHLDCVGISEIPAGRWYCYSNCKQGHTPEEPDRVKGTVTSLLFHGLLDLTRKDCVRENDGPMMIKFWKFDLIPFHNRNHSKYVILAHRLIAGVSGWLPQRLAEDLIWNRTVNLAGGPGRNIEMDLANEILNNEFKQSLKDAGGNISEETVARHSQLFGYLGRTIDRIYGGVTGLEVRDEVKTSKFNIEEKIMTIVHIMQKENVFKDIPGRKFRSFPDFKSCIKSKNPKRLHNKLKDLNKKLDRLRRIVN